MPSLAAAGSMGDALIASLAVDRDAIARYHGTVLGGFVSSVDDRCAEGNTRNGRKTKATSKHRSSRRAS